MHPLLLHARQFTAAISNYGLIVGRFRSVAGSSFVSFLFSFPHLSFVCGSVSRPSTSMEFSCTPIRLGLQRDMTTFDPLRSLLSLLLVVILFAALTSSINTTVSGIFSVSSISGREPPTESPSPTIELSDATGGKKAVRYSNIAEGGPILMSTPQHGNIEVTIESKPGEARTRESAPKERYASRTGSVVARKGVQEKIKPRKGVQEEVSIKSINQNMDLGKENVSFNRNFENMKFITENNPMILERDHIKIFNISNLKLNATGLPYFDDNLKHNINSNANSILTNGATSSPAIMNNTITPKVFSHIEKHMPKPKPTVTTVDEPEINESILLSRTKNPSLGMPRKIDYIVPVIITVVALPILGVAIFVLYRRGRDCWDKRHYRRMDFLIDGMYND